MTNDFIDGLELSARARGALELRRIESMDQFLALTERDIRDLPFCGRKTWNEIRDTQAHFRWLARGGADLVSIRSMLDDIAYLIRKHPYFVITVDGLGVITVVDTRPKEQADD